MELERLERRERGRLAEQLLERAHREVHLHDAGHDGRAREVAVEEGEVPRIRTRSSSARSARAAPSRSGASGGASAREQLAQRVLR